jgi:hypothetical protein
MRSRANRLMGGGRIVRFDTFTDANGTILPSHVPDCGVPWVRHPLFTAADIAAGDASIDNNRVHNMDAAGGRYYLMGRHPVRRNGAVACDVILKSDNDLSSLHVNLCMHPTRNTMVYGRYITNGNIWQTIRVRDGASASLGTSGAVLVVDQVNRLVFERRGSRFLLWVDGVLKVNAEDAGNPSGLAGIRFGDNASATVGLNGDNWIATR